MSAAPRKSVPEKLPENAAPKVVADAEQSAASTAAKILDGTQLAQRVASNDGAAATDADLPKAMKQGEEVARNGIATQRSESDKTEDVTKTSALKPVSDNIVLSSISELSSLYTHMEEIRGELRARGVQGQSTNVMVEMAFHNRQIEMEGLMEVALQSSRQAYGHGAITREELQEALENMLALEKDVAYTRKLCRQRGLDLQVVNFLTQLVRQNPGDGGKKAINTFLGYARACNIELSGIDEITQKYTTEPASVLPDLKRPKIDEARLFRQTLVRDISIGLMLTILMSLLVA